MNECSCRSFMNVSREMMTFDYLPYLKATNKWQSNGTGIFHQVAQHNIDQVYLYGRHPCPLPMQDLERQGTWLQSR